MNMTIIIKPRNAVPTKLNDFTVIFFIILYYQILEVPLWWRIVAVQRATPVCRVSDVPTATSASPTAGTVLAAVCAATVTNTLHHVILTPADVLYVILNN